MPRKKSKLAVLVGLLGIVVLAAGCAKKKPTAPPPPPPPPPPPAAPVCNLTAEPSTIEKGQSATLSWTSQNATDLDLQPGVGKVQAQGSSSVKPDDSTTYTMTATGPGGSGNCTARVTVTVPPPPPPPPPPPKGPTDEELFGQSVKDAYFDFDKSNIRPDAEQALTGDADFLKSKADIKFTIEGHCDERGSEEYNLGLGDRRATSAKNFLANLGVSADRVTTISYGKDRPVCTEHDEDCWQKNRRAHLVYGTETKQ
jgi:peptidoglycan-associated lipoprotein